MQTKPTSAYVHIPFCTQICYYCDFSKVFIKNQPVDDYLCIGAGIYKDNNEAFATLEKLEIIEPKQDVYKRQAMQYPGFAQAG